MRSIMLSNSLSHQFKRSLNFICYINCSDLCEYIKHVVRCSLLYVNVNLCFRHYKLEAEIASMTWRVNYRDVVRVPPGKFRGSVYSLARRNSQCVSYLLGSSCYVMYTISQTFVICTLSGCGLWLTC